MYCGVLDAYLYTVIFTHSIHFHCSLKYFVNIPETDGKNRPNVKGKEKLPAQYTVKFVPCSTALRICARALRVL